MAAFKTTPEQFRTFWNQYMSSYKSGLPQNTPAAAPAAPSGPVYTTREALTHPIPGEPASIEGAAGRKKKKKKKLNNKSLSDLLKIIDINAQLKAAATPQIGVPSGHSRPNPAPGPVEQVGKSINDMIDATVRPLPRLGAGLIGTLAHAVASPLITGLPGLQMEAKDLRKFSSDLDKTKIKSNFGPDYTFGEVSKPGALASNLAQVLLLKYGGSALKGELGSPVQSLARGGMAGAGAAEIANIANKVRQGKADWGDVVPGVMAVGGVLSAGHPLVNKLGEYFAAKAPAPVTPVLGDIVNQPQPQAPLMLPAPPKEPFVAGPGGIVSPRQSPIVNRTDTGTQTIADILSNIAKQTAEMSGTRRERSAAGVDALQKALGAKVNDLTPQEEELVTKTYSWLTKSTLKPGTKSYNELLKQPEVVPTPVAITPEAGIGAQPVTREVSPGLTAGQLARQARRTPPVPKVSTSVPTSAEAVAAGAEQPRYVPLMKSGSGGVGLTPSAPPGIMKKLFSKYEGALNPYKASDPEAQRWADRLFAKQSMAVIDSKARRTTQEALIPDKAMRERLAPILEGRASPATPEWRKLVGQVKANREAYIGRIGREAKAKGVLKTFLDEYLTRVLDPSSLDQEALAKGEVSGKLSKFTRFRTGRESIEVLDTRTGKVISKPKYDSIDALEAAGFKVKSKDYAALDQLAGLSEQKAINVSDSLDELLGIKMTDGRPASVVVKPGERPPADYRSIDKVSRQFPGKSMYFHPKAYPIVNELAGTGTDRNPAADELSGAFGHLKRIKLLNPIYHPRNLKIGEMAFNGPLTTLFRSVTGKNPMKDPEAVKQAVSDGVYFFSINAIERDLYSEFNTVFDETPRLASISPKLAKGYHIAKTPITAIEKTADKFIFEWIGDSVMMNVYQQQRAALIEHGVPEAEAGRIAAELANRLGGNPRPETMSALLKNSKWLLLARNWMITNAQILKDAVGAPLFDKSLSPRAREAKLAIYAKALVRGTAMIFAFNNAINYQTTGHSTLGNEPGHRMEAMLYQDPKTKKKYYYTNSYGFIGDYLHAAANPEEVVGNKVHPVVNEAYQQLGPYGRDRFTGKTIANPAHTVLQQRIERFIHASEAMLPIGLSSGDAKVPDVIRYLKGVGISASSASPTKDAVGALIQQKQTLYNDLKQSSDPEALLNKFNSDVKAAVAATKIPAKDKKSALKYLLVDKDKYFANRAKEIFMDAPKGSAQKQSFYRSVGFDSRSQAAKSKEMLSLASPKTRKKALETGRLDAFMAGLGIQTTKHPAAKKAIMNGSRNPNNILLQQLVYALKNPKIDAKNISAKVRAGRVARHAKLQKTVKQLGLTEDDMRRILWARDFRIRFNRRRRR